MKRLRACFSRFAGLFQKRRRDREFAEELESHLQLHIEDNLRAGMTPREARRQALIKLGGIEQTKEIYRDRRGIPFLDTLFQDLRFALRMLRKSPGFTAVAILTLALGIGANTAIFSAVNGILLEPLLYAESSRLVTVDLLSIPDIRSIQKHSTAFERTAIYRGEDTLVSGGATAVEAPSSYVSDDFFSLLGVKPLLGRPILPEDTQSGHVLAAVLSYPLWMDEFGGDSRIVGRSVFVDRKPFTVIGVMPKGFNLGVSWLGTGNTQGLWMPFVYSPSDPENLGRSSSFVARLKKGVTLSQAKAQLKAISIRLAAEYPKEHPKSLEGYGMIVTAGVNGRIDPRVQMGLLILLGAVGFVLLMACVNVTSLLVARAWTRQKELAIRRALGATRLRIVRQLLSESLLLATAGGALSLFFSLWGIRLLRAIAPPYTPRADHIRLDGNVLWFTMGLSLLASVLVGLVPALHASSRRMGGTLKGGLSGSFAGVATRRSHRLRSALVVLEVALAVIVVVGGALMARSFYRLTRVNTGVRADHVLTMRVQLPDLACNDKGRAKAKQLGGKKASEHTRKRHADSTAEQSTVTHECAALATKNVLDGIRSLPGVQRAALSESGPLEGGSVTTSFHYPGEGPGTGLFIEGRQGNQLVSGDIEGRPVTPGLFAALGIRLLKGRDFGPGDLRGSPPVAIVSQSFAAKYIPGNPLGKRFSTSEDKNGHHEWMEIIGVVNDVRDHAVKEFVSGRAVYYTPFWFANNQWEIIVRTSTNPMAMVPAMERVVRSVDKDAPITKIETVDQIIADSAAEPRFQTALLGAFGVLGLLLAIIGIYGVISYSVIQRTHEIGVRMALGAQPGDVLGIVIREGMLLAGAGVAIGIGGALALGRVLQSLLFEIKPTDPTTFIGVALLLTLVALFACYIPARRAMRVDPMVALRYE